MPVKYVDFPVDQGSTFVRVVTWLSGGIPPSFAGATARMQASVLKSDPVPVIAISTTPSAVGSLMLFTGAPATDTTSAVPSSITITIADTATPLVVTDLRYDLVITWADGTETRLLEGRLLANAEVTP